MNSLLRVLQAAIPLPLSLGEAEAEEAGGAA